MPGCLLWCVRTDITCLWLTAVNWSNILAVCDMLCIMFCLIFPSEKILWKTQTKASSTSSSVSRIELCTYVTCTLSPHQLRSSNDPISSSLCNDNCAHLISKHIRGRNWHRVSRIKPFIIPDRRAFLSPFIRFVIFRRCLLGWALRTAGIIRDGAVAGSPSDLALALKRYTNNSHARGVVCPLPFSPASLVVLSVFEILCWPIKAAPGPLMAFRLVS